MLSSWQPCGKEQREAGLLFHESETVGGEKRTRRGIVGGTERVQDWFLSHCADKGKQGKEWGTQLCRKILNCEDRRDTRG